MAAQPRLPERDSGGDDMERALTGRSSSRRRRAKERSSAAVTEERGSPREAAGGMGAGPALVALLLAGSVLSATLLDPGRRAEPGERPRGLGAAGTVHGPARDVPTIPGAQDLSEAPGPLWGGLQCRLRGSCDPGARPSLASQVQSRASGLGDQSGSKFTRERGGGGRNL